MTTFPTLSTESPRRRSLLVRMAIIYSSLALLSLALVLIAVYELASGDGGFVVMLSIFGVLFLLTGFWARHYLRDLTKEPVVVEAEVMKKWHKGNLFFFFMPSYYLLVDGKIFSVQRIDYAMLLETDLVRIHCYPHSLAVDYMERYDEVEKKFIPAASGAYSD